jgi:ATP-binding cassette subfamily B protein
MLTDAIAQVVSLGAVLPFIGVLVAPERVFQQPVMQRAAQVMGIATAAELTLPLTVFFAATALVAGAVRLMVLRASTRFGFAVGLDLSSEMYRRTLYQPYQVHVARNSSEIISGIASKASTVVTGVVLQVLFGTSAVAILAAILVTSLAINTRGAAWSAAGFSVSYLIVTVLSRRRLTRNGVQAARAQTQLYKTLQEGLGGIRDILLDGTQAVYCDVYNRADRTLRIAQGSNSFLAASPRFVLEALGIALLAFVAFGIVVKTGDVGVALPVLGALALGAHRMIPSVQQAYASWSAVVANAASLRDILALLDQPQPDDGRRRQPPAPMEFRRAIRFDHVHFRYTENDPWVIDDLTFEIPQGARVGIVGSTGSGKSTAADLMMGLLEPSTGAVLVDGQAITGPLKRAWQRTIAHVPQTVFLSDASLAENIAFGVPPEDIDPERVRDAARRAQIADFIETTTDGYATCVGERGVRLSGGQRQRIGIARALHKRATVLVFDEATSALDTVTEQAVMESIEGLGADLTIVIIAHRLTTICKCEHIVELGQGRLIAQGRYDALLANSGTFAAMAGLGARPEPPPGA